MALTLIEPLASISLVFPSILTLLLLLPPLPAAASSALRCATASPTPSSSGRRPPESSLRPAAPTSSRRAASSTTPNSPTRPPPPRPQARRVHRQPRFLRRQLHFSDHLFGIFALYDGAIGDAGNKVYDGA